MKRVFIIHGWEGSPKEKMHQWIKNKLEEKGYEVKVPEMPNSEEPEINAWVSHIKKIVGEVNQETFFIGHSIGCQAVLRFLVTLESGKKIGGIVLVAPWMHLDEKTIEEEGEEVKEIARPWMETPIDWDKVRILTDKIVAIFSDDDPYVPVSEHQIFKNKLGAKIIIKKGKGHFIDGSNIEDFSFVTNELKNM